MFQLDHHLETDQEHRKTIDGKLILLSRYFSEASEVVHSEPPSLSSDSLMDCTVLDVPNHQRSSLLVDPLPVVATDRSESPTDTVDAEYVDEARIWSPPASTPALTDLSFYDDEKDRASLTQGFCYQNEQLSARGCSGGNIARVRGPVGLPASPRPCQRPAFVPLRTIRSTRTLEFRPDMQDRRCSAPDCVTDIQRRNDAWLPPPSNQTHGPYSAPLPHESGDVHHLSVIYGADDVQRSYESPSSSACLAPNSMGLLPLATTPEVSYFDRPALRLPAFPLGRESSPPTSRSVPIEPSSNHFGIHDDMPQVRGHHSIGLDSSIKQVARPSFSREPSDTGTLTEGSYKITRIQPNYPDFQLSTPEESEFVFTPPTPMELEPLQGELVEEPLQAYQRHVREGQESRSLFRRISPTFGYFSRRKSDDTIGSVMKQKKVDRLGGLQNYFRTGTNRSRRVSLEGLETSFTPLQISSPMGPGLEVALSAVPESGSSADTDKFWW